MSVRARWLAVSALVLVGGAGSAAAWGVGRGPSTAAITASGGLPIGQADSAAAGAVPTTASPGAQSITAVGEADWDRFGTGSGAGQAGAAEDGSGGDAAAQDGAADDESSRDSTGVLWVGRSADVSGCGAGFASTGETLMFSAAGVAADASVSLVGKWASLGSNSAHDLAVPSAKADAEGSVGFSWAVPAAPEVSEDATPRGYAIQASGLNPAGGVHTAYMIDPVVAYPGVPPCAVDDAVSTSLGTAVEALVLANDTAPSAGSLDKSTVEVRAAAGGVFSVDSTTGVVTFTPDAGFWGTVETTYAVYDNWGIGVQAALSVTVDGGCTVTGTAGVELIEGTDGDDVICVPDRDDHRAFHVIDAKDGDDLILGGAGVEWVYGGDGDDVIYGNGGDDRIVAGAGADTVHGGDGMDSVYSDDLADRIVDDDYETVLSAPAPAQSAPVAEPDWVWSDVSQTVLVDVLGNDHDVNGNLDPFTLRVTTAPASGTAAVAQDSGGRPAVEFSVPSSGGSASFSYEVCDSLGQCASADVTVMVGTADCTITGTSRGDRLRGTPGDDVICGLGGNDTIWGLGGDDVIVAGRGHDTVWAGDGDDVVWGGLGNDALHGEAGGDWLWGGPGADRLWSSTGADRLVGGPGDDVLTGGDDADRLWGGSGGDTLKANGADDLVWGGDGDDILRGGDDADTVWGGPGDDTMRGGAGDDTLWGGSGDDTLYGLGHDDVLWGGPGADRLEGGDGDDRLWGGPGTDSLNGNGGKDHLDGGPDADTCRNAGTRTECE